MEMEEPRGTKPPFQAQKDHVLGEKEEMGVPTVSSRARCLFAPGKCLGEEHGGSRIELTEKVRPISR